MPEYTIFDKTTGKHLCVMGIPKSDGLPKLKKTEIYLPGKYKNKVVFVNEESQAISLHDKSISSVKMSQNEQGVLLENLENPTRITITGNGATFHRVIIDGTYQFSIDIPGDYVVKCESDIELPIEFKVKL